MAMSAAIEAQAARDLAFDGFQNTSVTGRKPRLRAPLSAMPSETAPLLGGGGAAKAGLPLIGALLGVVGVGAIGAAVFFSQGGAPKTHVGSVEVGVNEQPAVDISPTVPSDKAVSSTQPSIGEESRILVKKSKSGHCEDYNLTSDFGSGVEQTILLEVDANHTSGKVPCPQGSLRNGDIEYSCLDGTWSISHDCFDCAAFSEKVEVDDKDMMVELKPGKIGESPTKVCEFNDATQYRYGHVKYTCGADRQWTKEVTCRKFRCLAGDVSFNFGKVGEVRYHLPKNGKDAELSCPLTAANPIGKIFVECGGDGNWKYLRDTCQDCKPMSVNVGFDGHWKEFTLGGGMVGDQEGTPCSFPDKRYRRGELIYECTADGWKLQLASCSEYECPPEDVELVVRYGLEEGAGYKSVQGVLRSKLPGSMEGQREIACPPGPNEQDDGKLAFACSQTSGWSLERANCYGDLETPAALS